MTLDQHSFDHATYKDPNFSKFKINQSYPIAFFSQKMIPIETWYKTHDQKLLVIVEVIKTWHHYLKGYKYKVFILTNYNNHHQFIDMKSLSSCQAR